ncbi:hypothetical protein FGG78_21570 [Thioclava sp. BHET1]|nr:hypothetical protein FGG78_21570 [Thioclava sp. BHET1]
MTQVVSFDSRAEFQARLQRLNQDIASMRDLKVEKPSSLGRIATGLRMMALFAVAALALKAAFVTYLGNQAFAAHVAELSQGDSADRLSAMLIQPDVVTATIAGFTRQAIFEQTAPSLDDKAHAAIKAVANASKANSNMTGLGMAIINHTELVKAERHPLKVSVTGRTGTAGMFVSAPGVAPAQPADAAQLLQ